MCLIVVEEEAEEGEEEVVVVVVVVVGLSSCSMTRQPLWGSFCDISLRKRTEREEKTIREKMGGSAEREEIQSCPLPPLVARTAGPCHHPTIYSSSS